MTNKTFFIVLIACMTAAVVFLARGQEKTEPAKPEPAVAIQPTESDLAPFEKIEKSEEQWRSILTPKQFSVMRKKGTEAPRSSPLLSEHRPGVFRCAACDLPLFASDAKFESGTGWPSFTKPFVDKNVFTAKDSTLGMERDEVLCARCGAHLGHVFDDGPPPTHLRYCMNGVALKFEPRP
ncbi:MAG: peptide-methionine (R)-S-oxide reductase MsrB [Verrucomicrobiota bacterium]|nr:peptide-methionine (R)-S-oxide reductase MsrB [Verrucomicrobiota bacterium]